MKKTSLFPLLLVSFFSASAQTTVVKSPDTRLLVEVSLVSGAPQYAVTYDKKVFLEPSPLGVQSSIGDFSKQLKLVKTDRKAISDEYSLSKSKVSKVKYRANELNCTFINAAGDTIFLLFRVSNQDVAFRYRIPENKLGNTPCIVTRESSGFHLPDGTTTFITPQAPAMTGYEGTKPSYEEVYTIEAPVGKKSQYGYGYTFPALFHLQQGGWLLLSETGTQGNYPGTCISDANPDNIYAIQFPQAKENNGQGTTDATATLPMETPWRTLTIGNDLKPIVASTVATDLVAPVLQSTKTFMPGRASWSWLVWQDESCNFDDQMTYINLAADLKCEYILIDAFWDTRIGRDKMKQLADYARSKNVAILLWYNSNGNWNGAPQSPKNRMDTKEARIAEMQWMQSIGIKGIKVDFFGGDKQVTMQLYHDILTDATTYGLVVDFHGTTLPRGWERMYPSYLTSEAALVSENLVFGQPFNDTYARTATLYPFTRNAVAAMDFGPVILNNRLSRKQDRGTTRRTSDAFEVATSILFFSPLQNWGLTPDNLKEKPAYLFDLIRQVPTTWDETRYVDGYPGKYCVLARRKGNEWYIAAVNGENATREITVQLPMLRNRQVAIIRDGQGQESTFARMTMGKTPEMKLTLSANGGAVIYTPMPAGTVPGNR